MLLELLQQAVNFFKRLQLLLYTLFLSVCGNFEAEGQRYRVKRVLLLLIIITLKILEELVFGRYLMVVLEMIHHLSKIVTQAIKVDLSADRTPSEMEMRLRVVEHFSPEVRPGLVHHSLHQLGVVPGQHLILEHATTLRLGQEVV